MRLNFSRKGEGKPLLLLHGLFGSSNNWAPLADKFAPHFDVVSVDLRNHGRSPHHHDAGVPAMASDLSELLDALKLQRVFLLGHSLGGRVAMRFALDHSDRVERLIVADMTPAAGGPIFPEIFEALRALDLSALRSRQDADERLKVKIPHDGLRAFLLSNLARSGDGNFRWKMNLEALNAANAEIRAEIKAPAPFQGPALFIRGEDSDYVKDADFDGIRALFPAVAIETIVGAGHWLHVDQPEHFYLSVLKFLS